MSEPDFLEPLPKADRNSELEQHSINALNSALPVDKFVFRREGSNDAGVDGTLELKMNSRYTGLRAQVQLKSTDSSKTKKDGSVSVRVAVANLYYLLNGNSPLYVLYVAPRNELRFAWAREERKRLEQSNPNWMRQETIAISFVNILTPETIAEIHAHILNEARMQRQVNDILSAASNTETLVIGISPETLNVTDPNEAKRVLLASGTLIVSSGYPEQVRKLAKLLDFESEQLPRILLVRAHAEHSIGRYQTAYALLSEAMLRRDELSEDDQQFMDFLRVSCEYLTGRLTVQEFTARINEKPVVEGHFAYSYRINQLRSLLFLTRIPSERQKLLGEFRLLMNKIENDATFSDVFKLYAKSTLLEAEGLDTTSSFYLKMAEANVGLDLGSFHDIPSIIQNHLTRLNEWATDLGKAVNDAKRLGHYRILASAVVTNSLVHFHHLISIFSLHILLERPLPEIPDATIQKYLNELGQAIEIFTHIGDLEGELRAKLIIADFYDFTGQVTKAREIAIEVLPKAEAMGYARQIEHAKDHIAGKGLMSILKTPKVKKTEEERIIENANFSDDKVREYAAQMLRILDLPIERLPVMEREYFSIRGIARERVSWCRHIDLHQDLRHMQHASTKYKKDPDRSCVCNAYLYKSMLPHPDWETIIRAFKRTYCENCKDRNPFRR